mgnify:CR=1 FL=1
MREFLDDAYEHREDGYGRAQKHVRQPLPKRFYSEAGYAWDGDAFVVTLDGRPTRTPGQVPVRVPAEPVAAKLAEEWGGQGAEIDPETMPHVRLVNSAVEGGEASRPALIEEVVTYAGNDLLLYRADSPAELVALQEEKWDAVLVALARHLSVGFSPTVGILHRPQAGETLDRLRGVIAGEDLFRAAALSSITGLTGSGLLAIALRENLVARDAAWIAAHVDEDYQASLWGEDFEAARRRAKRRAEYDAAVNLLGWLR